jgi:hypothetical protein
MRSSAGTAAPGARSKLSGRLPCAHLDFVRPLPRLSFRPSSVFSLVSLGAELAKDAAIVGLGPLVGEAALVVVAET